MTFSEKLRTERERLRLTQAELAAILDVSFECVSKWERSLVTPSEIKQEGALNRLKRRKGYTVTKVSLKKFRRDANPGETGIMIFPPKPPCGATYDADFSAVIAGTKTGGFYLDEVKPEATRKHWKKGKQTRKPSKRKS